MVGAPRRGDAPSTTGQGICSTPDRPSPGENHIGGSSTTPSVNDMARAGVRPLWAAYEGHFLRRRGWRNMVHVRVQRARLTGIQKPTCNLTGAPVSRAKRRSLLPYTPSTMKLELLRRNHTHEKCWISVTGLGRGSTGGPAAGDENAPTTGCTADDRSRGL